MTRKDIGRAIKKVRTARGMTQVELSQKAGVDDSYVSMLERGMRNPTIDTLLSICDALDITLFMLTLHAGTDIVEIHDTDEVLAEKLALLSLIDLNK